MPDQQNKSIGARVGTIASWAVIGLVLIGVNHYLYERERTSAAHLASAASANPPAEELRGKVIAVQDGDTVTLLDEANQQHKIRVNGIDAPEMGQDFGEASKQHLANLCFGQEVTVIWSKRDKYNRIIGTVINGTTDAGLVQLRDGFAWYYKEYSSDVPPVERVLYANAEAGARAQLRGLWRQPGAKPPWEFRHPEATTKTSGVVDPRTNQEIIEARYRELEKAKQRSAEQSQPPPVESRPTATYTPPAPRSTGRTYIRGPRGGCYYINSNGNKTYVDRSMCN